MQHASPLPAETSVDRRPWPRVAMMVARRVAAVAARACEKACSMRSQRAVQSPHRFDRRCPRHPPKSLSGCVDVDVDATAAGGAGRAVGCGAAGCWARSVCPTCRPFPTLPGPARRTASRRPARARCAATPQVVSTPGSPTAWESPSYHRKLLHRAAPDLRHLVLLRKGQLLERTGPRPLPRLSCSKNVYILL